MKAIGKWSVNNRVTVNLIMFFVIFAGFLVVKGMRREMFPQFSLDMIHIGIPYPGATPEDVEEGICVKVEEQIKGIEGISRIISTAREGYGSILMELESGVDIPSVLDDIKTEVDSIDTFPGEAEKPVIIEIVHNDPSIMVAVYGDASEKLLRKTAEKIRDDLVDTDQISLASLVGVRDYEIGVELSEEALRNYGISFDYVAAAIKNHSIDLPGGEIKTESGEILVRTKGQLYTGSEFETIPLITLADGAIVRLGDVAEVKDAFEDSDLKTRFNGKPATLVSVNKTDKEDIIEICNAVKQYIANTNGKLPPEIKLATWQDMSSMVNDRIELLLKNGSQGMILVFIVLAMFLNLRLAFWVASGIPISFMIAFVFLDFYGATINMLSLFSFIMTLGILVDDAIIIGENVYTHSEMGKSTKDAVIDGLGEVGGPVVMAVTTTIVAFLPLMFISGIMGKFIAIMPKAVIAILIASLLEAFIILPAHLEHALFISVQKGLGKITSLHEKFRKKAEEKLIMVIETIYKPAIAYVTENKYFTLSIAVGILIISIGLVASGHVSFVFFPKSDSNWVIAEINYPLGSPIKTTEKTIDRIEKKAFELNKEFEQDIVVNSYAIAGVIPGRDWKASVYGGHCGEVWIEIVSAEERPDFPINMIANKWRKLVGEIPGMEKTTFSPLEGGPAGNPIEIQLRGDNLDLLGLAADELKAELKTFQGTFDITDDFRLGKEEKRLRIKEESRSLGITMADMARQVRQGFYGEEALRIQRGKDDIKVLVRYDEATRRSASGIENMRIRTVGGAQIPLETVAEVTNARAYSTINRVDRKRIITVISDIDESVANASEIVADLKTDFLPKLAAKYPGVKFDLEGQAKRTKESMDSMGHGFILALMAMFLLLASQFKSYAQPMIIMMAIPFGIIGAIIGHLIMGISLTLMSIIGIVALSGIVVNDSLILIDFINRERREGMAIKEAVKKSGVARFRAVILTSFTTLAGLFPLMLERSFQAQFLIPMAVSITFGLLVATMLTLLYVPALYLILDDIINYFGKKD